MQARGEIGKAGVFTPDEAIPPEKYMSELAKRGVMIKEMTQTSNSAVRTL
jgi:hypothetical protein